MSKVCIACGEVERFCSCGTPSYPSELIVQLLGENRGYKIPPKNYPECKNATLLKGRQIVKGTHKITAVLGDRKYIVPFIDITLLKEYGVEFYVDDKLFSLDASPRASEYDNSHQQKNAPTPPPSRTEHYILGRLIDEESLIPALNANLDAPCRQAEIIEGVAKYIRLEEQLSPQGSLELDEILMLFKRGRLGYTATKLLLLSYFHASSNVGEAFEILVFNTPYCQLSFKSKSMIELKTLVAFGVSNVFPELAELRELVKELVTTTIGTRQALEIISNQIFKKSRASEEFQEIEKILQGFKEIA